MLATRRLTLSIAAFALALVLVQVSNTPASAEQVNNQCDDRYYYGYPNDPHHAFGSGFPCSCQPYTCHGSWLTGTCSGNHYCS